MFSCLERRTDAGNYNRPLIRLSQPINTYLFSPCGSNDWLDVCEYFNINTQRLSRSFNNNQFRCVQVQVLFSRLLSFFLPLTAAGAFIFMRLPIYITMIFIIVFIYTLSPRRNLQRLTEGPKLVSNQRFSTTVIRFNISIRISNCPKHWRWNFFKENERV